MRHEKAVHLIIMSEATYRIINDTTQYRDSLNQLATGVTEFSIDAWHSLANFVQESPTNKYAVLGGLGVAVLFVMLLIKRTRFF